MSPCKFPRCPALADKDRDYCPVHRSERVLERAKQIVINQFTALPMTRQLNELMGTILHDLERTV